MLLFFKTKIYKYIPIIVKNIKIVIITLQSSSRRTFSGDGSLEIHEVEMNPNISLGGLNDGLLNTKDISQLQLNTKLVSN